MKYIQTRRTDIITILVSLSVLVVSYIVLCLLTGQSLFEHSVYDQYTLQAIRWWQGHLDLGQNYDYLELAVFNGKYYCSFPPVPSLPMALLTPIFGRDTPNNFVNWGYCIGSFYVAWSICRKAGLPQIKAALLPGLLVFGSSMLTLSLMGGVWFQAQNLCMLLSLAACRCAMSQHRGSHYLSLIFWALSVGCRPFSILFLPLLIYLIIHNTPIRILSQYHQSFHSAITAKTLSLFPLFVAPALIGFGLCLLNFARFGNILEFGHNYLPEFTNSDFGQISLSYVPANLKALLRLPIEDGKILFPKYEGFAFFLANPFYLFSLFEMFRQGKFTGFQLTTWLLVLAALFLTLCHKTMGGWQFGSRYTIDMLPYLLLAVSYRRDKLQIGLTAIILTGFGIILNVYGALWFYLGW